MTVPDKHECWPERCGCGQHRWARQAADIKVIAVATLRAWARSDTALREQAQAIIEGTLDLYLEAVSAPWRARRRE